MKPTFRVFALFFLLMPCTGMQAQHVLIKGRIIDRSTGYPVVAATITGKGSPGTISDQKGKFAVAVEKLPAVLTVSHVSYGQQTITLTRLTGELIIRLEPRENKIPEVRITAGVNRNQVRILNRKARYTIIDYQFDDPYLWFLGCVDNSPKGTRLYLGYPNGDSICSEPVAGTARLYRDFFGKIHLVKPDTVYQLFAAEDSIRMIYPERTETFMSMMKSYEVAFGDGLARLDYNPRDEELYLVYKDSLLEKPNRIFLYCREDKSFLEKEYAWIGRYFGSRTLRLMISQQKDYYLSQMRSSLFTFQDTLYVVNLNDNQLHAFGRDLDEFRVVPLTFYFKQSDDITDEYKPFRIITDPVRHQAYVVFHLNSHYTIKPLNTETGLTGPDLILPRYSAMDKLSIHDNTLYYIYPEKVFPYYLRLFSMELTL